MLSTFGSTYSRLAIVSLFCISLTSCSTKFSYNFLDWAIQRELNRYVKFTQTQKKFTRVAIDEFHLWHRKTQLPIYANYLRGLMSFILKEQVTADKLKEESDKIQFFVDESIKQIVPNSVSLIQTLSDKQVAQLANKLQKEREKFKAKFVNPTIEKQRALHVKRFKQDLKPWFGKLTKEQNNWIQEWSEVIQLTGELTLAEQERWAQNFQNILTNRQNKAQLKQGLDSVFFYTIDDWHPELQKRVRYNQDITLHLLARLINRRSPIQNKKIVNRLSKLAQDFEELGQN